MELKSLCLQIESTLRQAAEYMKQSFTVDQKDGEVNLVTSTDLAIQHYLEDTLCGLLPNSQIFGEEGDHYRQTSQYLWVVDPIDGTTNFSRGIPEYSISIGLIQDDICLLGVVYSPERDRMFSAVRGEGAKCNGQSIHVSQRAFSASLFCTALSLYKKEYASQCMAVIWDVYNQCNDIRRFGSAALELCYLACGECDLYFEFRVFPWDYAGALVILEESGGIIRGEDGRTLTFDRTTPIIAANTSENFEKLLSIVNNHIPEFPYKEVLR